MVVAGQAHRTIASPKRNAIVILMNISEHTCAYTGITADALVAYLEGLGTHHPLMEAKAQDIGLEPREMPLSDIPYAFPALEYQFGYLLHT